MSSLEQLLCAADLPAGPALHDHPDAPAGLTEFVLEPSAYDWLVAEGARVPPDIREALRRAVPEDAGYAVTMSRELAIELASFFADEGERQGGALEDMWLIAATTIGLEVFLWSPLPA
jgi:hypothetical protein